MLRLLWLPRARAAIQWAIVAAVLIWMFGPTLAAHVEQASNPLVYNDDVRQQVSPFYRYYDSSLLQNDYLGDYYLACYPWGYHGLYAITASVGADPAVVSKVAPYVLLLMTLAGLGLSAQRIGGMFAAWAARCFVRTRCSPK